MVRPFLSSAVPFNMSDPSIDQFAEALSKEPDWYSLGVFLGVPSNELDRIGEIYNKISVTRCLIEMYKCLDRLGKAPSWDFIASKLRALDHHALAEHIDSTYIHPSPSESSGSNSDQSGAGIPSDSVAPKVPVPPEVSKQYFTLSLRLTDIYLHFKDVFAASSVKIEKVQHVIKRHWGIDPHAGNEATWENLFLRLDEECCMFDDPHVLSVIIDKFLSDDQVLSRQMGEFEKAVDSFKSSAKMGHLVDLLKKKKRSIKSNIQTIRLKVKEHWSHCTLKHFETAMKILLESLYDHLSSLSVDTGCYCISWITSVDFPASKLLPKNSEDLFKVFKIIGIISLQIGKEMVYDSTEEVPGCEVLEAAMLQAIELNNTWAIEILLAMGCSPEVATYNGDHVVTNVVNIREKSVDDGSGGGVDHVCVLGHNEHIEAIIDPSMRREPVCATCGIKENQIKQLYVEVDTLQFENKRLKHPQQKELKNEAVSRDCVTCKVKEKQIKQLYVQVDTLQLKNKNVRLKVETLSSESFHKKKGEHNPALVLYFLKYIYSNVCTCKNNPYMVIFSGANFHKISSRSNCDFKFS